MITTLELKPKLKTNSRTSRVPTCKHRSAGKRLNLEYNGREKFRAIRGLSSVQNIDLKLKSIYAVKKIRSVCTFL